jgi:sec-independent protein translocase protein TatB
MFDVAPTEFLLVAVVALLVIGPKDLPKAMRVVGYWVGRMRGVARQFRSGFDSMVREAELEEMEKRWAAENERIMREHAASTAGESAGADPAHGDTAAGASDAAPAVSPAFDVTAAGGAASAVPFDDKVAGGTAPAVSFDGEPLHDDATADPIYVEQPVIRPAPGAATPPHGDGVTS